MNTFDFIKQEQERQANTVELIASENFVSDNVMAAVGSCLTCKYAEGYPGRRYYGGCSAVDGLETYCQQKWREVFNTDYHVNVQPHSGTNANLAAYMAVLQHGDRVLSMSLESGGCDKMASLVWGHTSKQPRICWNTLRAVGTKV